MAVLALAMAPGCAGLRAKLHAGANKQGASQDVGESGPYPFDTTEYVLGVNDVIEIDVFPPENQYKGPLIVGPDGKISLPHVGEIVAAEKTREGLAKDIAEKLTKAGVLDPEVTVRLQESKSKRFYIQGQVRGPGEKPWIMPIRVQEALVQAGGFQDFADTKHIIINRDNGKKILHFNYNEVIKGKHMEQNVWVEPGDMIVVK